MIMASRSGYADVLVGLQYGDEGKARVVDHIAGDYDIVARFNGGANAGHTIATPQGAVRLRQVPSAVLHRAVSLYIGSGCAVGLAQLAEEIAMLEELGIQVQGRLAISDRCLVVQPLHVARDHAHGASIGTTGNGIGPCYADHALRAQGSERTSCQLRDLIQDSGAAFRQMTVAAARGGDPADAAALDAMRAAWPLLRNYVISDPGYLAQRVTQGARVLFEGAQSVMLDVTHGEQPWVTASHTVPAYAYVGGDLPCCYHRKTIGVAKAIVSRVGAGHFPSELGAQRSAVYCADAAHKGLGREQEAATHDPVALLAGDDPLHVGMAIRMLTGEYGTGTGRPRRIGLLDVAQLRRTVQLHGVDELFLNKCDALALFAQTRDPAIVVVDDEGPEGATRRFPAFAVDALPNHSADPLPPQLDALLRWLADTLGCRLRGVGLGPAREQMRLLA